MWLLGIITFNCTALISLLNEKWLRFIGVISVRLAYIFFIYIKLLIGSIKINPIIVFCAHNLLKPGLIQLLERRLFLNNLYLFKTPQCAPPLLRLEGSWSFGFLGQNILDFRGWSQEGDIFLWGMSVHSTSIFSF